MCESTVVTTNVAIQTVTVEVDLHMVRKCVFIYKKPLLSAKLPKCRDSSKADHNTDYNKT